MMTNFSVGLILGIGVSAWVYNKMMRSTGGNTRDAALVAGIAGVASLVLIVLLLSTFFK